MPAPGDVIADKYRLDAVLGQGGMGIVFAATHLQLDQKVALKFIVGAEPGDGSVTRFLREARAAAKLKSEYAARVLDVDTDERGGAYIAMEYLDGQDLRLLLARRGRLSVEEASTYVVQATHALAEAHVAGVVHRDVKTANLFLTHDSSGLPVVKVLDFGISKLARDTETSVSAPNLYTMLGTPHYMSPEQALSPSNVDRRTDVWALGVVLYTLVSGRHPFEAADLATLVTAIVHEEPAPLGDVPRAFAATVARCLAKRREDRFPDVGALARDLAPFVPARIEPLVERVELVVAGGAAARRENEAVRALETAPTAAVLDETTTRAVVDRTIGLPTIGYRSASAPPPETPSARPPARTRRATLPIVVVGVAAIVAGGAAFVARSPLSARGPAVASSAATDPPQVAESAPTFVAADPTPPAPTVTSAPAPQEPLASAPAGVATAPAPATATTTSTRAPARPPRTKTGTSKTPTGPGPTAAPPPVEGPTDYPSTRN